MIKRLVGLIVTGILLVSSTVFAADKVKIGYLSTMSGPGASLGMDILDGFKLGIKHCGEKLCGLPLELIVGDDQLGCRFQPG